MTAIPKPVREPKVRKALARESRPRRSRKGRPGRVTLKRLDDLARPLCRSRGRCEAENYRGDGPAKGCSPARQWAHIMSRTYKTAIRWSPDNCLDLCAAHHKFFTDRPAHWRRFLVWKLGEANVWKLEERCIREMRQKPDRAAVLAELLAYSEGVTRRPWENSMVIER